MSEGEIKKGPEVKGWNILLGHARRRAAADRAAKLPLPRLYYLEPTASWAPNTEHTHTHAKCVSTLSGGWWGINRPIRSFNLPLLGVICPHNENCRIFFFFFPTTNFHDYPVYIYQNKPNSLKNTTAANFRF
jgi:hypothetical protein